MPVKARGKKAAEGEQTEPLPVVAKKRPLHQSFLPIFNAVKATTATHPKLCKQLIKVYLKSEIDAFFEEFVDFLKFSLVVEEKQPQVERMLAFVAFFTTANKVINKPDDGKKDGSNKEKNDEGEPMSTGEEETEEDDDEPDVFLTRMFQFLLNNHEANSNAVRYRVCQLINKILNSMGESASLDDDLFSTIYDTMLQRLLDKKPAVRVQAILALNRLQDPRNKECPVIKAYLYHLSMDPSSDVRRAALLSVAITFQTLPHVLQRTRDKNYLVRRQAYLVLAQKVHIRSLQINQRVRLLSEGLNDRIDSVKVAVQKNLLQAWLRFVNGSVLDLLTCLDVETSTKGAELALDTLFMEVPAATLVKNFDLLDANKFIPLDKLKPESALYWKALVKHLKNEKADEELDFILPDLSAYCLYIKSFADLNVAEEGDSHVTAVRQMEKEFVLQQLLLITKHYDLCDEVGRKSLNELVRALLVCQDVSDASINFLVDIFARLTPPHSRVTQLAEIVSDLREPAAVITSPNKSMPPSAVQTPVAQCGSSALSEDEQRANKVKVAKIRVELNQVREELEECVRSLDLDKAQALKLKLRDLEEQHDKAQLEVSSSCVTPVVESSVKDISCSSAPESNTDQEIQEKDDPDTLARCLAIVCQMLKSVEINSMNATLHSLHDNLLLPCLKNQDVLVQKRAIQALSLLCLISKELAQKHITLFLLISQIDEESKQVLALNAVFDILLLYGVSEFNSQDIAEAASKEANQQQQQDDEEKSIISILSQRLETEESEVRTAVAMGLCKLLQAARFSSPKLLSQLVLLWYNPITEEDNELRHMLGVFFPLYASYGGPNQECISSAVLPVIRTLVEASNRSPLAEVDIDDVANFMLSLCSPSNVSKNPSELVNFHDSLVFSICSDIIAFPDSALCKHIIRMLRHLSLTTTNYTNLRQVLVLTEKMNKRVRERTLLNAISKFQASITGYLKLAPVKEEVEEVLEGNKTIGPDSTLLSADASMGDTSIGNRTGDMSKRKRQLYSSTTEYDMLSSEAESNVENTPKKKCNVTFKTDTEDDTVEQALPQVTFSEDTKEEDAEKEEKELSNTEGTQTLMVSEEGNEELELQASQSDECDSSEDLFASPDLTKTEKSNEKKLLVVLQKMKNTSPARRKSLPKSRDSSTGSNMSDAAETLPQRRSRRQASQSPAVTSGGSSKRTTPSSRLPKVAGEPQSLRGGVRRNTRGKPVGLASSDGTASSASCSSPEGRPATKRQRKGTTSSSDIKTLSDTSSSPSETSVGGRTGRRRAKEASQTSTSGSENSSMRSTRSSRSSQPSTTSQASSESRRRRPVRGK